MVMTGSFLAPMGAGAQASAQGWRWSYRTLGIVLALTFVLFLFFFEETKFTPITNGVDVSNGSDPDELVHETSRKQDQQGSVDIIPLTAVPTSAHHEIDSSIPLRSWRQRLPLFTYTRETLWPHYWRPLVILLTFPPVLFTGVQYASGVIWLTIMASTLGFIMPFPPYNFTPAQVGYMSTGPFIGNLIGVLYGGFCFDRAILFFSRRNKGLYEPEMRLYLLHLPALAMAGGLIMFGVSMSKVSFFVSKTALPSAYMAIGPIMEHHIHRRCSVRFRPR
jgi:MFS family permease